MAAPSASGRRATKLSRDAIVNAALTFLAREGWDALTINALATQLNSGEGTVGKLVKDPSVYNNTNQLLGETRNLIAAIRKNPKKYLTIRLKLF